MNSADCAMMPGARKARYGTPPVSMTPSRENVWPKISSHSAGCTILVNSSVRSWRSFCSSTSAKAPMRKVIPRTRRQPRGARTRLTAALEARGSTDTARRLPAGADGSEPGRRRVLDEVGTGVVAEHVLEAGGLGQRAFQLSGRADHL